MSNPPQKPSASKQHHRRIQPTNADYFALRLPRSFDTLQALCEGDSQWGGDPDAPTKTLLNSFHLVNAGDVVWSSGDVIVSSAASFVNRGTLLIEDSDTADEEPSSLCHTTGTTCSTSERRIRSPREGERGWTRDRLGVADSAVAAGGAGSAGGDAASWAWEELSYDG